MRAEVKFFSMVGGELKDYWPDDPQKFCIGADVTIGPEGTAGGDIFSFQVCSPLWLEEHGDGQPYFLRHIILMKEYDEQAFKTLIYDLVSRTSAEN